MMLTINANCTGGGMKMIEKYNEHVMNINVYQDKILEIESTCMPNLIQVMSGMPHGTGTSNQTADTAIRIAELNIKYNAEIKKCQQKIKLIDSAIATLRYKDQVLVNKRIKDMKSFEEIAYELNYSDYNTVQKRFSRLKNKIVGIITTK